MKCMNPSNPEVCLCPIAGNTPRSVLASPFINSWLTVGLTQAANALAADPTVSDERLWAMVATLEDEASAALWMWRNCQ